MKRRAAYLYCSRMKSVCLLVGILVCLPGPYSAKPKESADGLMIKHALAPFAGRSIDGIFIYLDQIRPAPVKDSDKALLLQETPLATGEAAVRDPKQLAMLKKRIRPALALHRRITLADFYIFHFPYPVATNKPGALIGISTTMLGLIGDDDSALIGIMSHELAHEYVAMQMVDAYLNHDLTRQRELELFCDAVAVATLIALNLDPAKYASVLERGVNFSPEVAKLNNGERDMPNISLRKRLIFEFSAELL